MSDNCPESVRYYKEIGCFLNYHSYYKTFDIYRQWDVIKGRPLRSYFAVQWKAHIDMNRSEMTRELKISLHAKNLSGIKDKVTEYLKGAE